MWRGPRTAGDAALIKIFEKEYKKDRSEDKRSLQKLRKEVEQTKRALSFTHKARLEIEALSRRLLRDTQPRPVRGADRGTLHEPMGLVKQVMEDPGLRRVRSTRSSLSAAPPGSRRCSI